MCVVCNAVSPMIFHVSLNLDFESFRQVHQLRKVNPSLRNPFKNIIELELYSRGGVLQRRPMRTVEAGGKPFHELPGTSGTKTEGYSANRVK